MFEVILINGATSTTIHYPSADKTYPHFLNLPFKEILSQAEQLSFSMPFGNPGYGIIQGLTSKIRVVDTRDDSTVFSGRVMNVKDGMSSSGIFTNEVVCEGALNYLCDTQTRRWHFQDQDPIQILTFLLNEHNSKVDNSRNIYVGIVEITQNITIDTNYETTLNAIVTKLHNILGGDLVIRETAGVLYLDYLTDQGVNNEVKIRIGTNAKQMIREYDPTDVITRAIPMGYGEGINQLVINSVNSGIEYLEDATAKVKYGVIEGIVVNKDIQNANTLKIYGQTVLDEKKRPKLLIDTAVIDRSVLAQYEFEKYGLGDTLNISDFGVYARVVERDRDLINSPWSPTLAISTRPITLSTQIGDLKQRNLNLEQCPQGSTYIDTFGYAENIDETHSFQLPIWLSPDILYVNRVRLHVDSQKYRAYEKGVAAGGGSTSGASSESTSGASSSSTSGASSSSTSDAGGTVSSASGGGATTSAAGADSESTYEIGTVDGLGADVMGILNDANGISLQQHMHFINWAHTHNAPAHTHIGGSHTHGMAHTHVIPPHIHAIEYGIFEDTYPADVQIKINDVVIPGVSLSDGGNLDMDISLYVGTPGETYNLEVTSSRNGRVNVWCSVQAFIQIK